MLSIHRTAWAATRESTPEEPIDFDKAAREWERRGRESSARVARTTEIGVRLALARVEASRPAWTLAELMRQIKPRFPRSSLGSTRALPWHL
jgi:hypothetical protein